MTRGMINRPDLQGRNNQGFCRGGGIKKKGWVALSGILASMVIG